MSSLPPLTPPQRQIVETFRRRLKESKTPLLVHEILKAANGLCAICQGPFCPCRTNNCSQGMVIDHKIPLSCGGGNWFLNLRPVHSACNGTNTRQKYVKGFLDHYDKDWTDENIKWAIDEFLPDPDLLEWESGRREDWDDSWPYFVNRDES